MRGHGAGARLAGLLAGLVLVSAAGWASGAEAGAAAAVESLSAKFTDFYEPVKVDVKAAVEPYKLPLDLTSVGNFDYVTGKLPALKDAQALLVKNGFVVTPNHAYMPHQRYNDFTKAYGAIKKLEVPVFVTSDSLLHMYHIQFDETLKEIEERVFAADVEAMLGALHARLLADYGKQEGALKSATGQALASVTVSLRCLTDTSSTVAMVERARAAAAKLPTDRRRVWRARGAFNREHGAALKAAAEWGARTGAPRVQTYPAEKWKASLLALLDAYLKAAKQTASKTTALPDELEGPVAKELELIAAHGGFAPSPVFTYREDYSQYVPRGHYTRSELLKRYFKSVMWLGRLTHLIKGKEDTPRGVSALVSTKEAKRQTISAAILAKYLHTLKAADGRALSDVWERVYSVTAYYVGLADDLTPAEYRAALVKVVGDGMDVTKLLDDKTHYAYKVALAGLRKPAIYSGTGDIVLTTPSTFSGTPSPEDLAKALGVTQGFRIMGQRFVPDSYLMGKAVFPTVGAWRGGEFAFTTVMTQAGPRRGFPRGLDVAAVFGSDRAPALVKECRDDQYEGYNDAIEKLAREFGALDEADWNRNLYWSWIWALKGLWGADRGKGYQAFQNTDAWQDRQLHAALASWAQLRHDTILYAKQSYTMRAGSVPRMPKDMPGYVEPVPEFYARLLSLSRMTRVGLDKMAVLSPESVQRLQALEDIIARLLDISVRELANKELAKADYDFIKFFGSRLKGAVAGHSADSLDTRLIADVHTDGNSGKVLEEGTGRIDLMYVVYRLPGGALAVGVGPTLSYYEFKQPMSNRLTDEAWRGMLDKEPSLSRPAWVTGFIHTSAKASAARRPVPPRRPLRQAGPMPR